MYSGRKSESYIETTARLDDQQNDKTSGNIPPDPDSLLQDLKRQLQVKISNQLNKITMTTYDQRLYGWKLHEKDGMMVTECFAGSQIPPRLQRKPCGKKRSNLSSETQP